MYTFKNIHITLKFSNLPVSIYTVYLTIYARINFTSRINHDDHQQATTNK